MINDHINRVENNGGILSVDDASELIDVYQKNKSENRIATNVVASKLVEQAFNHKLNNLDANKDNVAVFTAGGPASFKSTTAKRIVNKLNIKPQFVFDSNLANFETSKVLINKVLRKNNDVIVAYSYLDPVSAFKKNIERAGEDGRVVSLTTFARQHVEARKNLFRLAEYYKDNPKVKIEVAKNETGKPAKIISLDELRKLEYNARQDEKTNSHGGESQNIRESVARGVSRDSGRVEKEKLLTAITRITKEKYSKGEISKQVYRGALRGHLDERKFTAGKTSKKSPIKSPTKVKQMK